MKFVAPALALILATAVAQPQGDVDRREAAPADIQIGPVDPPFPPGGNNKREAIGPVDPPYPPGGNHKREPIGPVDPPFPPGGNNKREAIGPVDPPYPPGGNGKREARSWVA